MLVTLKVNWLGLICPSLQHSLIVSLSIGSSLGEWFARQWYIISFRMPTEQMRAILTHFCLSEQYQLYVGICCECCQSTTLAVRVWSTHVPVQPPLTFITFICHILKWPLSPSPIKPSPSWCLLVHEKGSIDASRSSSQPNVPGSTPASEEKGSSGASHEPSQGSDYLLKVHMKLQLNLFLHIKIYMKVQKIHVLHPVHCRWWLSGRKLTLKIWLDNIQL